MANPEISLKRLVAEEKPLITPLAHDALSARMIEQAGFRSIAVGGSAMLAARYGLPDIGLAALGEMAAGVQDIVAATQLPVMVDGDDGYGDVEAVAHMVELYTRLGVSGIVLEDQLRGKKQPGDSGAVGVAAVDDMVRKVKVAVAGCAGTEISIIARCDAYQLEGLDGAMRRAHRYLDAGAHGLFVPAIKTAAELSRLGREFTGRHLVTAEFEGRETWLPPAELYAMGFRQVVFPALLITRVAQSIDVALRQLRKHAAGEAPMPPLAEADKAQAALRKALNFDKWQSIGRQP
jgi:2-methylisocitrate lyase-like PEP mutase family enzyme